MKKNKFFLIIIFTLILSSCSSSSDSSSINESTSDAEYGDIGTYIDYAEESNESTYESPNNSDVSTDSNSNFTGKFVHRETKYHKEGFIENTSTDFNKDLDDVKALVKNFNGYFEKSSYTLENYYTEGSLYNTPTEELLFKKFTSKIKVPVNEYQELYNTLKQSGVNITNESKIINKSEGYYSLKSQLEVKKLYAKRLLEIINNTKNSQEYLNLYAKYFDLLNEIDSMESKLNRLENATTFSTINFTLVEDLVFSEEVIEAPEEEVSFLQSITTGLKKSFSVTFGFFGEILIILAYTSVPIIIIAILIVLLLPFIKKIKTTIIKYIIKDKS